MSEPSNAREYLKSAPTSNPEELAKLACTVYEKHYQILVSDRNKFLVLNLHSIYSQIIKERKSLITLIDRAAKDTVKGPDYDTLTTSTNKLFDELAARINRAEFRKLSWSRNLIKVAPTLLLWFKSLVSLSILVIIAYGFRILQTEPSHAVFIHSVQIGLVMAAIVTWIELNKLLPLFYLHMVGIITTFLDVYPTQDFWPQVALLLVPRKESPPILQPLESDLDLA